MIVHEENQGELLLANNPFGSAQSKCIDVRCHFFGMRLEEKLRSRTSGLRNSVQI